MPLLLGALSRFYLYMSIPKPLKNVIAASDRVPFAKKLAYALGGPVDILSVWVLVSIA